MQLVHKNSLSNTFSSIHIDMCSHRNVQYVVEILTFLHEKPIPSSLALAQRQLLHQQFIQSCDKEMCKIVSYVAMDIRENIKVFLFVNKGEIICMASDCSPWSNLELLFPDWRQFPKNFGKFGTIFRFVIPAPLHDLVDLIWALLWAQHSVTCIHGNKFNQKYASCELNIHDNVSPS